MGKQWTQGKANTNINGQMIFTSDESMLKLKAVSESAFRRLSMSLSGTASDELLNYFKQRTKDIISNIDSQSKPKENLIQEFVQANESRQAALLDKEKYQAILDGLLKAFKDEIKSLDLDFWVRQVVEKEAELLIRILDRSIAADLTLVLFDQVRKLELEKGRVRKMLRDVNGLLERDRQRLAFDLHDGPAQAVSSAILQTDILEDLVGSAEAKRELQSLKTILSQCLHELRMSIYSLKPQSVSRQALIARIKEHIRQFSVKTGIEVDFTVHSKGRDIPAEIQVSLFRVIQEALNNISKHAKATRIVISMTFDDSRVSCSISDNGVGFNICDLDKQVKDLEGYGLISMRDRVEQFLGIFDIKSTPGKGTCIEFTIPL
ncbi:MAG: sensor histidine kinase [Firmicutes bacterium]|nr:sensor histidine kinase [Bacillota bacterium]